MINGTTRSRSSIKRCRRTTQGARKGGEGGKTKGNFLGRLVNKKGGIKISSSRRGGGTLSMEN